MEKQDLRTSSQVAIVFKISARTVQRLAADGILETVDTPKGRKYPWDLTVERYVAYLTEKAKGRERKQTIADLEEEKLRAEAAFKSAKAEAAKMELAELQGKLHRAEDVEAITTDHVLFVRSMLMAMPGKLAVDLAGNHTATEQAERVKREVYFVLEHMANYRYDPDEYERRVKERQGWEIQSKDEYNG